MGAQIPDPSAQSDDALQRRLGEEDQEPACLRRDLAEARRREAELLDQQTATAEILRAIASASTDPQPMLDAVARNAARVCGADDAHIRLLDGDALRLAAGEELVSLAHEGGQVLLDHAHETHKPAVGSLRRRRPGGGHDERGDGQDRGQQRRAHPANGPVRPEGHRTFWATFDHALAPAGAALAERAGAMLAPAGPRRSHPPPARWLRFGSAPRGSGPGPRT